MIPPTFVFATCRPGAEAALKREVATRHGGLLTPAFMRPQLITWKVQGELPGHFRLGAWLAQVSGVSLGMAKTPQEVAEGAALVKPVVLNVIPREVSEEGADPETWARVATVETEVRGLLDLPPKTLPSPGDTVVSVIVGAEGEPMLVGSHRHQPGDLADPAALLRLSLPVEAPSRAWMKMEQALDWLGIQNDLQGRTVLELGSSPGGASHSLLSRGATVHGVDTGAMDARVLAHPAFHHLKIAAGDLRPGMVPDQVDLLVSDMNLEPRVVCQYVEKFASRLRPLGLILTLKINSAKVEAELPDLIHRIRDWAPGPVYVRQLPANRQEVTLVSWQ